MKKIITLCLIILLGKSLFAQELTKQQSDAIEKEQMRLKEGSINYEQFQQRVQSIKEGKDPSKENQNNGIDNESSQNKSTSITSDTSVVNTAEKNTTPTNNISESKTVTSDISNTGSTSGPQKKSIYNYNGLRPGDELMRFSKQFYAGMGTMVVSTGISFIGAILIVASGGTAGIGMMALGTLAGTAGVGITLTSFLHINKAGKIMNQIDEQR